MECKSPPFNERCWLWHTEGKHPPHGTGRRPSNGAKREASLVVWGLVGGREGELLRAYVSWWMGLWVEEEPRGHAGWGLLCGVS